MGIIITTVLVIALIVYWIFEYRIHQSRLSRIPIRVHINGSRGKSSVTRLIGAALRKTDKTVVTKTTGTDARIIHPDGAEEPINRIGPANVLEQKWVVKYAVKLGADILVTECMAVDPELQWVLQNKYIKGTIGVLTNVRPDHLDVMGPTVRDAADAMSAIMPRGGICFTGERERFDWLKENAEKVDCKLILTDPETISDDEINKFGYIEHKENVALALAVARHFGVERQAALEAMWNATPDPGVLKIFSFVERNQRIRFANAFAANDPESTIIVWEMLSSRLEKDEKIIAIANSRADRIQRSLQLGKLMGQKIPADLYILVGANLPAIADVMVKNGIPRKKIVFVASGDPKKILDFTLKLDGNKKFLVGIGNIGGPGHKIADFFEEKNQSRENQNAKSS